MSGDGIRNRLQADLREAMQSQDRPRISVLRTALTALGNAEAPDAQRVEMRSGLYAAETERRDLTDEDVRQALARVRDELIADSKEMARLRQPVDAERLRAQAAIVEGYLDRA